MKKQSLILFSSLAILFLSILNSCTKINEATQIGDELIPPIDNITTFETYLSTLTDNKIQEDTTEIDINDYVALGHISNDPVFGQTTASAYFDLSSATYRSNPFVHRDSLISIDSVVLSLSYRRAYGDTLSMQTVRVYEIAPTAGFNDSTLYRFSRPEFQTNGAELGSKSFVVNTLNDSMTLIRATDTTRVGNVLRIPLSQSLAQRFASFDTTNTPNGGFRSDSIFKTLFKGIALKTDQSGNALTYFDLNDQAKTRLTVYFRVTKNGAPDTTQADFYHASVRPSMIIKNPANFINGQANIISRTPGGEWPTYLANSTPEDDKIYLQSAPGSYATIKIPGLDTLQNSIIHKAELIIYRIPSTQDNIFTPPVQLLLDKLTANRDSAYFFEKDFFNSSSGFDYASFGGSLRSDNTFRFNITRHVQDIVTQHKTNYTLRLHAPLRATLFGNFNGTINAASVQPNIEIANGRVVLAGGNFADPNLRMRLRIVYSKI